jgi:hypothetical protein
MTHVCIDDSMWIGDHEFTSLTEVPKLGAMNPVAYVSYSARPQVYSDSVDYLLSTLQSI